MTPTLIVTRPLPQSEAFVRQVQAEWAGPMHVIISPLIQIVPIAVRWPDADGVIFTSANGVRAAAALGQPAGLRAWCVGEKTAHAAQKAGFQAVTGPGDANGLVAQIISAQPMGKLAHIRGKHAVGDVGAKLTAAGLQCVDLVAYDQQPNDLTAQALAALQGKEPVVCPLFSPRSGTILMQQGPFTAPIHAVAISAAVKVVLDPALGWDINVAAQPDGPAMLQAVLDTLHRLVR